MVKVRKFDQRTNLIDLIKNEESFLLQIYSLESVEIFEEFLKSMKISFKKEFSSVYRPKKNTIYLILDDGSFPDSMNFNEKHRCIFYSNKRNFSFIPFRFSLSEAERIQFIQDKMILESNKTATVSSIINKIPDPFEYSANSLNYSQSVIMMCLIKVGNFLKLCEEVKNVDPELNNSFAIKLELNWLCSYKFCKKIGNSYKITVSNETVRKICDRIGFGKILDFQKIR